MAEVIGIGIGLILGFWLGWVLGYGRGWNKGSKEYEPHRKLDAQLEAIGWMSKAWEKSLKSQRKDS